MTRDVAPCPARSFSIQTLPRLEPKPPITQSSSLSRSSHALCRPKCQVSCERFCSETYSTFAVGSTKTSTTAFVYATVSGAAEERSSITVKRAPSSATITMRQ